MTYDQHLTRSDSRVRLPGTAWVTIMTGLSAAFLVVGGARADTLTTLHSFCDVGCVMDGQTPSVLVMDQTGTLYGATSAGGKFSKGTLFELVPNGDTWKYKVIDEALRKIAESLPRTQEEVFQSLEGRHVVIPPAEPFVTARGWIAGFRRDAAAARAWLSKRRAELDLSPLPRGPKNPKK